MNTSKMTGPRRSHPFAILTSIALGTLLTTASFAHNPVENGFNGYESNQGVSASTAKRLARSYLGYWIENHNKMHYKCNFKPLQLYSDDQWQQHINPK